MTLPEYYSLTAVPALAILALGGISLVLTRKKSAQFRQFVCGATLVTLLVIGVVPFLPRALTPTFPDVVTRRLPLPIRLDIKSTAAPVKETISIPAKTSSRLELLPILALIGAAVSSLLALRLAGSLLAVARLRKQARPASSRIRGFAEDNVRVVESLSSPVALGGFKPMILLPAEAEEWPEDRIRAVLIHEQAHLRNGDPNWQMLAELACLMHWFNPLAWFFCGAMRREAERAADDAVLRAGVRPSDYASELVAFAAKMGVDRQPVAWTAFARKSGVNSRVRAILTPQIERKPMTKPMKITAIFAVSMAAYAVSAYAYQDREAIANSPYKDVREGKTVAASPRNGFVGELADGRKIEVIQVSRRMPNGEIVAWKPDGTPIPTSNQVKYAYHNSLDALDTHTRYIFVKFPSRNAGSTDISVGLGSGTHDSGSPKPMIFAGGGLIGNDGDQNIMVGFIGIPDEDGSNVPATFSISDGAYENHGKISDDNAMFRNVKVWEDASPQKQDTSAIEWAKSHKGPVTALQFDVNCPDNVIGDLEILPILKNGSKPSDTRSHGNYGEYLNVDESNGSPKVKANQKTYLRQRRYFAYPKSAVQEFQLLTRTSLNCELRGIASNPKGS